VVHSTRLETKRAAASTILRGLTYYHNKEKTPVRAKDLWTEENTAIFLKYCEDARLACYHMVGHDTGARPGEILAIRIGDVEIKQAPSTGRWYGQVEVGRGGKTTPRTVPLIDSIPYLRVWLKQHPMGESNPDAFLFISQENSALYRNIPLQEGSIRNIYRKMKDEFLPLVLDRPDVSLDDKMKIRELLKKPFHPYIFRHTTLTRLAPKMNSYNFNLHSGHVKGSKMVEVYTHELGGESSREILKMNGILLDSDNDEKGEGRSSSIISLNKQCPLCNVPNKPDARFCINCQMVLTYDAYTDAKNEAEETKKKLAQLEAQQQERFKEMQEQIESLHKLALKQSFRVIEQKVAANPPPYIEGADKMTAAEVLYEMKKRGCNTWEG
jgi:integrase